MRLPLSSLPLAALALSSSALAPTALAQSPAPRPMTCGSPDFGLRGQFLFQPPSDCGYTSNTSSPAYDPNFVMEIPVVWHVIHRANGTGDLPDATIVQQMQMMNDDFRPPQGQLGNDARIRFVLATEDPQGNPTTGIERVANDGWFLDGVGYTQALAWDTNRYLNVYTLTPQQGAIGYVTDLPQGGIVGNPDDGVRMLHSAIASSDLNHVLSHEVGHHLGLLHTFGSGFSCANTNCDTQGDLICDTNPHAFPTSSCGGSGGCGSIVPPRNNYMNYQDVACVWEFTPDQIRRMRCTLEHWRPLLWSTPGLGTSYCSTAANSSGAAAVIAADGSEAVADNDVTLSAVQLPANQFGYFLMSRNQASQPGFGGSQGTLCVGSPQVRFSQDILNTGPTGEVQFTIDLSNLPQGTVFVPGDTWNFQLWFRDQNPNLTSNTTDGLSVTFL